MTITLSELTIITGRSVRNDLNLSDPLPTIVGLPVAQGDVIALPRPQLKTDAEFKAVPSNGVVIVAGIHDHLLQSDSGATWAKADGLTSVLDVAVVDVPKDAVCFLMHTDEHGATGLGEGRWLIRRQREMAEEQRIVAD